MGKKNNLTGKKKKDIWSSRWAAWIIPILVVILWWLWGRTPGEGIRFLPTIPEVWTGFVRLVKNGTLWENIKISTIRGFKGLKHSIFKGGQEKIASKSLYCTCEMEICDVECM